LRASAGVLSKRICRFADQWPDLYGRGWLNSLVALYARGEWQFTAAARTGYSVVLFGSHGMEYRHPRAERLAELARTAGVDQHSDHLSRAPRCSLPCHGRPAAFVSRS